MGDVAMGFAYLITCCCCCFSSDPGPEGSGLGYAKRDPREDLVDQEFKRDLRAPDHCCDIYIFVWKEGSGPESVYRFHPIATRRGSYSHGWNNALQFHYNASHTSRY
ncbi:uncharacterized protein ARMOST_15153 [Armillaria ostoyae]|uniref:Uncharacterized protein n=1 Tax=Armillaria ostoyae TaxID=47428 RepID=A0A284RSR1_ARMOS|nr:uncharacterized protein ARMOST_15153 [Armillaria ostoyae]